MLRLYSYQSRGSSKTNRATADTFEIVPVRRQAANAGEGGSQLEHARHPFDAGVTLCRAAGVQLTEGLRHAEGQLLPLHPSSDARFKLTISVQLCGCLKVSSIPFELKLLFRQPSMGT